LIVFNHNIHFVDEPDLLGSQYNPALETIRVACNARAFDSFKWLDQTEWIDMSLQKGRYTAEKAFGECLDG